MEPARNTTLVDSTVRGAKVAMTIAQDALAHIMNVLTDLYEDAEAACVREYSTNALDSHIAAGVSRPIEVETPSNLRPVLRIRDYGVGLTGEDIAETLSRYGASTKRDSNDAVGMLGLGCKSALAYVDQFTIVGFKDGRRTAVSVARDEHGAGTMTVLEDGPTVEPNGAEISIPAKRDNQLADKAETFFSYWAPGTVLLNGAEPAPVAGVKLDDTYTVADWNGGRYYERAKRLIIVMGNVPYPAPASYRCKLLETLPARKRLIVRVPIGTVYFAPSRESLQDTPATHAAIDQALAGLPAAIAATVQRDIDGAANEAEAARAFLRLRDALGGTHLQNVTYRGADIPASIPRPEADSLWIAEPNMYYSRSKSRRTSLDKIPLETAIESVWVLDYTNENWTAAQRRKLDAYVETHGIAEPNSRLVLTSLGAVPASAWLGADVPSVSWSDVRRWKDPNNVSAASGKTYAGTYNILDSDGRLSEDHPAKDIDQSKPLYYAEAGKWDQQPRKLRQLLPDDEPIVALLPSTRVAKFLRTFPQAVRLTDAITAAADAWRAGLTDDQREALALGPGLRHRDEIEALDGLELDDPAIARAVSIAKRYGELESVAAQWRPWLSKPAPDADGATFDPVVDPFAGPKYLLLSEVYLSSLRRGGKLREHVEIYMNAAHAAAESEA